MDSIVIVLLLRLTLPLLIFTYPLGGAILAMMADLYDFEILERFGWGAIDFQTYQLADKLLDLYYLTIEYSVTRQLNDKLAKRLFTTLFFWRAVAVAVFGLTNYRPALFWGPNIFEVFYLFYFLVRKSHPEFRLQNNWRLIFIIVTVGFSKLLHEYSLHVDSLSDLLH